jgi:hypothetical protein
LGFATLGEVVFDGVNLEKLQVEVRVEEKTPKMTGTSKNFRRNYDSEPSSGSYTDRNYSGIYNLVYRLTSKPADFSTAWSGLKIGASSLS